MPEGYVYKFSRKISRNVHILNKATNKTWCKLEHSTAGRNLERISETMPEGRALCSICVGMEAHYTGKPDPRPKKPMTGKQKPFVKGKSKDADFYASWEWKQLRYEVLRKHGARCMLCGADSRSDKIVVDHIKPRKLHPELELEFNNCQVLCDQCNRGKGRHDDTDWRDYKDELEAEAIRHMKTITG